MWHHLFENQERTLNATLRNAQNSSYSMCVWKMVKLYTFILAYKYIQAQLRLFCLVLRKS